MTDKALRNQVQLSLLRTEGKGQTYSRGPSKLSVILRAILALRLQNNLCLQISMCFCAATTDSEAYSTSELMKILIFGVEFSNILLKQNSEYKTLLMPLK